MGGFQQSLQNPHLRKSMLKQAYKWLQFTLSNVNFFTSLQAAAARAAAKAALNLKARARQKRLEAAARSGRGDTYDWKDDRSELVLIFTS